MKYDPAKVFPYPVLRPQSDDFPGVEFQATPSLSVRDGKLIANLLFEISCQAIEEEISRGNAKFVSTLSSRETYFQSRVITTAREVEVEFDVSDFRGEVRIESYVVAEQEIVNFDISAVNEEYLPGPINYLPGEILAQDEPQLIFIDRDLFKPVQSVFDIVPDENVGDGQWRLRFDQDHVEIAMNQATKDTIDIARNVPRNRTILLNSIYFAAVMEVLHILKTAGSQYESYKWCQVFLHQIGNRNVDLENGSCSELAAKLMQHPLRRLNSQVFGASE